MLKLNEAIDNIFRDLYLKMNMSQQCLRHLHELSEKLETTTEFQLEWNLAVKLNNDL
jgi:hypothetical protein